MSSPLAKRLIIFLLVWAANPAVAQNTIVISPNVGSGDLELLRSQVQRDIYQLEQQRLREQDRRMAAPDRPAVPSPRPSCQLPVFGAALPAGCG